MEIFIMDQALLVFCRFLRANVLKRFWDLEMLIRSFLRNFLSPRRQNWKFLGGQTKSTYNHSELPTRTVGLRRSSFNIFFFVILRLFSLTTSLFNYFLRRKLLVIAYFCFIYFIIWLNVNFFLKFSSVSSDFSKFLSFFSFLNLKKSSDFLHMIS